MSHLISRDLRPSTVYHVGIYAYDRNSTADSYATGRHIPLCGQEKIHDGHWLFPQGDEVDRKKLCTRCAEEIRHATDLLPAAPRPDGWRPLSEFRETGLLWLINRQVFHPRGFAIGLNFNEVGDVDGWVLYGDGIEPWNFKDGEENEFLAAVNETFKVRS